jgi:hypothetical protein
MKHFTIKYYEDSFGNGDLYPKNFESKTSFSFDDMATWDGILYQFCKHLEAIGYVGVIDKVYVDNLMTDERLFTHPINYRPKGQWDKWFEEGQHGDTVKDDEDTSS